MTDFVTISAPSPEWPALFRQEAACISVALGALRHEILHVGSTSIRGAHAKPIIDMLLLVEDLETLDANSSGLLGIGYEAKGEYGIPGRRYFRKSSAAGIRTHHVHAFVVGSEGAARHRAFRDYMNAHPRVVAEYSALKRALVGQPSCTAAFYIAGKDEFVKHHEALALKWATSSAIGAQSLVQTPTRYGSRCKPGPRQA